MVALQEGTRLCSAFRLIDTASAELQLRHGHRNLNLHSNHKHSQAYNSH